MVARKTTATKKTATAPKTERVSKTVKTAKSAKATKSEKTEKPTKPTKAVAKTKKTVVKTLTDLNLVECVAEAMSEKKGERILSMDLRDIPGSSFDFFVLCQATSAPQVRAIADAIEEQAYLKFKTDPLHKEGYANAEWVLLDFGGVVAHIFLDSVRDHYKLEELWGDSAIKHFND